MHGQCDQFAIVTLFVSAGCVFANEGTASANVASLLPSLITVSEVTVKMRLVTASVIALVSTPVRLPEKDVPFFLGVAEAALSAETGALVLTSSAQRNKGVTAMAAARMRRTAILRVFICIVMGHVKFVFSVSLSRVAKRIFRFFAGCAATPNGQLVGLCAPGSAAARRIISRRFILWGISALSLQSFCPYGVSTGGNPTAPTSAWVNVSQAIW